LLICPAVADGAVAQITAQAWRVSTRSAVGWQALRRRDVLGVTWACGPWDGGLRRSAAAARDRLPHPKITFPGRIVTHRIVLRTHNPRRSVMPYVDGFVLAVPKDKIEAYKALAKTACAIWMEHGALDYVECIGDDVPYGELTSFPRAVMAKEDEIVVFSWIVYRDRETRDAVNKKVMADPRLKLDGMPFDGKRMIYGGFTTLLRASDIAG
jgi:uncharacterized protein YbaA (DUF1428 family)